MSPPIRRHKFPKPEFFDASPVECASCSSSSNHSRPQPTNSTEIPFHRMPGTYPEESDGEMPEARRKQSSDDSTSSNPNFATDKGFERATTDVKIRERLQAGAKPDEKKGRVYVMEVEGYEGIYKVGSATNPWNRGDNIALKCGASHRVVEFSAEVGPYFRLLEELIQLDLKSGQVLIRCRCGVQHREYFQLSRERIMQGFTRWERFLSHMPYAAQGYLEDIWITRLDAIQFPGSDYYKTHDEQTSFWDEFVELSWMDRLRAWFSWKPQTFDFWKWSMLYASLLPLCLLLLDGGWGRPFGFVKILLAFCILFRHR